MRDGDANGRGGDPAGGPVAGMSDPASASPARGIAPALLLVVLAVAAGPPGAASAAVAEATSLRVTGMTFVGSREGEREVVLRSQVATFRPEARVAELKDVSAVVRDADEGRRITLTCARVELDIDTNDFLAEGDVRGETGDGQHYAAPWVRYEHERGVLFTDAPVVMEDETGSFRGDGFRYHVNERRFELLGNVRVEQRP